MRGLFVLLTALLLLPVTTAISDLTIYSEAKYTSQESAPILVEFFHGSNDDDIVEDFEQMDSIARLHYFIGELVLMTKEAAFPMMMLIQG